MAPKDDYVFTRDVIDNNRLNLLHHYYVRDFGYLIHPRIPVEGADLRVADIGCGTGIWLLDASTRLPASTHFVGLDISLDSVPPAEVHPPNVSFRVWDMLRDPVPEELVGSFDIVAIRLMLYVLQKDEVPLVVAKLMQMLKPGGYLQWMEPDNETVRGEGLRPESTSENMKRMMGLLDAQGGRLRPKWVPDLAGMFADGSLVDVEADVHKSGPLWAYHQHQCLLLLPELIARKTENEQLAAELRTLIPLAEQETRNGAYLAVDKYVVTGKKA